MLKLNFCAYKIRLRIPSSLRNRVRKIFHIIFPKRRRSEQLVALPRNRIKQRPEIILDLLGSRARQKTAIEISFLRIFLAHPRGKSISFSVLLFCFFLIFSSTINFVVIILNYSRDDFAHLKLSPNYKRNTLLRVRHLRLFHS